MLFLLAGITYMDRVCLSNLAPHIQRDLGLSTLQMSFVFSVFAVAYAAFEIPTAWWGQRIGARKVLARIVLWWSGFTAATAAAWSYTSLLVIRFLFGAGEAGAWPNAALAFSRWIPWGERGRVQGFFFAAAHGAGGLTPLLVGFLLMFLPWRGVFLVFGALGIVWAVVWLRWSRDEPRDHPRVNQAEADLIERERRLAAHAAHGGGMWKTLASSPNVWMLCLAYLPNAYGSYFVMTWLPTYLADRRGFEKGELSLFAGLPLLLSVVGDIGGGALTDWLAVRLGPRLGRVAVCTGGYLIAGLAMFASVAVTTPVAAAVLIAVAVAASMLTLSASWATCMDIGGRHTAVVSAAMNTSGQIGAIASPVITGWTVQQFSDWQIPLVLMGVLYAMAALLWMVIDPRKRLKTA